jgi:hypothetical protein
LPPANYTIIGGPVYVVISQYKWLFIDINLENIKFFYA